MTKRMFALGFVLLTFTCLALAAPKGKAKAQASTSKSWTGVVSDDHCGTKHSKAGADAAACVAKCVSGGSKYALVSHGKVFKLDPQDKFADFAGKRVKVTGTMSGDTITATDVAEAKSMMHKKSSKKAAASTSGK